MVARPDGQDADAQLRAAEDSIKTLPIVPSSGPRQRAFPAIPNGWFAVAFSDEVKAGGVRPLRYLGRELVLFRSSTGVASVLDAHCPHLGAHLGIGGGVVGETLACPFHGWRFDAQGQC